MIYRKSPPIDKKFGKFIEKRNSSENLSKFDKDFKESLSINHDDMNQGINIWDLFMDKIMMTNPLIFYHENFKKYLVNVFKNFIDEGISHR
jgi:RNAse (barnase) inhibitor barstar